MPSDNGTSNSTQPMVVSGHACSNNYLFSLITNNLAYVLVVLGILTNFCCILVFSRILYSGGGNDGHMFHYLLAKSACDVVYFAIHLGAISINSNATIYFYYSLPNSIF